MQSAANFPFRLGEPYRLNVTRSRLSMQVYTGAVLAMSVRLAPRSPLRAVETYTFSGVHRLAADRQVNQISVHGTAVEQAKVVFASPRWRAMKGVTCANSEWPKSFASFSLAAASLALIASISSEDTFDLEIIIVSALCIWLGPDG